MRRVAIMLAAAALVGLGAPAARAGGGGACFDDASSTGTGVRVDLKQICFHPTVIHIRPGQTVTWTNRDDFPHTVTGMPGTFDSDELSLGQTFTHRFAEAGTYAYYCVFHRRMAGAVVVAGDIAKAGLTGVSNTGGGDGDTTPVASKTRTGSSPAAPITALAIAIPVAAGLGFGAGRRRLAPLPR